MWQFALSISPVVAGDPIDPSATRSPGVPPGSNAPNALNGPIASIAQAAPIAPEACTVLS